MERLIFDPLLTCPICNQGGFKNLAGHFFHHHKMSTNQVREETGYTGRIITRAQARLMAARSNALWKDDEVRQRRTDGVKASYSPELLKKRSEDAYQQWLKQGRAPITDLRALLKERAGSKCEKCGVTEDELLINGQGRLHLHHLNYDRTVPTLDDVQLLCASCHMSHHKTATAKINRTPSVAKAVGTLLNALGVDLTDENFIETPRRVAAFLLEHFDNGSNFEFSLEECSQATFPSEYDGMVIQSVSASGLCPHHLLPVLYHGVVAYLPATLTIGLSKLTRIAQLCLHKAIMQEEGTLLIADSMADILQTDNVAITLHGQHMCMMIRGVKAHQSYTRTSELRGLFRDAPEVRSEFMTFVQTALREVQL